MIMFKCPNCKLCIDLEASFKNSLCPMCGIPLDNYADNNPSITEKSC